MCWQVHLLDVPRSKRADELEPKAAERIKVRSFEC